MPSRRGDSWEGIVYHKALPGGRARRSFATKSEAADWEMESKVRLRQGGAIDMGEGTKRKDGLPYTIEELIEHVARSHWSVQRAGDKSRANAMELATIIGRSFPAGKVGRAEIDRAREALLKRGNAPGTINRKVSALSKALKVGEELGVVDRAPRLPRYTESEPRVRRFTAQEEAMALAFFERIGNQDMADYVVFSLDTGLRQGEVLSARLDDCVSGRVTVWGTGAKSGKTRSVPLTARAKALVERRAAGRTGRATVFEGLNLWAVQHYWGRLREVLHLEDDAQFVPHILRHEFCSRLADRGLNAPIIQALAGHSSLVVTQRYVHVQAAELEAAIARLQAA